MRVYNFQTTTGNYFAEGFLVHNCDLHARHRWLVLSDEAKAFRERMRKDPEYYDPRIAGWWCWGLCCWIGGGWCKSDQLDRHQNSPPQLLGDRGVGRKAKKGQLKDTRPRIDGRGRDSKTSAIQPGVLGEPDSWPGANGPNRRPAIDHGGGNMDGVAKKPRLTGGRKGDEYYGGLGVHADGGEAGNRPQLADAYSRGRGVHGDDSKGTCRERREWLVGWFHRLRDRLRTVRVCCGDWLRVCDSENVTTRLGVTGIFFDPPYSHEAGRDMTLYASESGTVAHDVRQYCLERGDNKMMRIALCGYEGEGHEELEKHGWTVVKWKSSGGYGNRTEKGKENARKERIWFSPHCNQKKMGFLY